MFDILDAVLERAQARGDLAALRTHECRALRVCLGDDVPAYVVAQDVMNDVVGFAIERGGRIVFVSSVAARLSPPAEGAYAATKAAISAWVTRPSAPAIFAASAITPKTPAPASNAPARPRMGAA